MAITNQERVGKAMELLREGLAPFVERELENLHPGEAKAGEFCLLPRGGEPYFPFDGQQLWLPAEPRERPGRELLEWHGDVVSRG
ncbi:MAG TPA: hypothetical protein VMR44_10105 [Thermoanaerobaculia bacterium]|nr:hypothetical protein [Thermoanaerobaculia bacterium]